MPVEHEFETTLGDELSVADLGNATYKVVETFVDTVDDLITFTHRIELHHADDLWQMGLTDDDPS
jgi:hypothetical protein